MPGETGTLTVEQAGRYPTWEYDLLRTLGGNPTNLNNQLLILSFWAQAEAVKQSAHNWLAVTQGPNNEYPLQGATGDYNSANVATFATDSAGVNGIAEFLRNGPQYKDLIKTLTNPNASAQDVINAIDTSGAWPGDIANIQSNYDKYVGNDSAPGTIGATPYNTPGNTAIGPGGGTTGAGNTSFTQCTGATIIGGGGLGVHWTALNSCQAKALVGGFLIGIGGVLMVGGLALMVTGSLAGSGLGRAAIGATPQGALANVAKNVGSASGLTSLLQLGGSRTGGAALPPASQSSSGPSREVFDGVVLNPAMTQYRRDNGDAATRQVLARQRSTPGVTHQRA